MKKDDQETHISEEDFYIQRCDHVKKQIDMGVSPYPHKFHVKDQFSEIIEHQSKSNEDLQTIFVQSAGRIMNMRSHARFYFFKVFDSGHTFQLVGDVRIEEISNTIKEIKRGDIVGFSGHLGRTKTGEFSVFLKTVEILSPCLRSMPVEHFGIKEPEIIYRKRYLDLLLCKESRDRFITRTKTIQYIRKYLDDRDFIEVETPMMNLIAGGAAARPFITHHNELKLDLYMRIATELYLKKLVVGGLNRVYEIGRCFRNEGIDLTHNPEFTSLEYYMAYADLYDVMDMTEDMLNGMVKSLFNTEVITYAPKKREQDIKPVQIDFSRPFKRIHILEELSKILGFEINGENIESNEIFQKLLDACNKEGIKVEHPQTLCRVLDKIVGHFIEPMCINPTFLVGYATITSPLAKGHRSEKGMVERFELFINQKEVCNAYTELNDPLEQRYRFKMQAEDISAGDDEAMPTDEDFCVALDYALPPTGGFGMGIDRLVMFLSNAANIKDVILFPAMKPENN